MWERILSQEMRITIWEVSLHHGHLHAVAPGAAHHLQRIAAQQKVVVVLLLMLLLVVVLLVMMALVVMTISTSNDTS